VSQRVRKQRVTRKKSLEMVKNSGKKSKILENIHANLARSKGERYWI